MFKLLAETSHPDHHSLWGLVVYLSDLAVTEGGLHDIEVLDTRTGYTIEAHDLLLLTEQAPGHEPYRTKNSKGLALMELARMNDDGKMWLSRSSIATNRKEWVSLEIDDGSRVLRYIMPHTPSSLIDHSYNIVQDGTRLVAIGVPCGVYLWGAHVKAD